MTSGAEFRDRRVLVMGLGRFGGGLGATRWLARQGARVTVTDRAPAEQLQSTLRRLEGLDVTLHLGGHDPTDLDHADLLVVNPAVDKSRSEFVQSAVSRGIPLTSELNLFVERCRAPIIGVTGTVGKSTTTAMIFDVLHALRARLRPPVGRVWLGGNIGASLLEDLPDIGADDCVVLELSSFQLEDLAGLRFSPHIGVLTNLSPQHLDRHGDWASYLRAKSTIFTHQQPDDFAVINSSVARHLEGCDTGSGQRVVFRRADAPDGRLRVPGAHNLENAAATLAVGQLLGLSEGEILSELEQFNGLPHRLEFVRRYQDVDYYNDSKSTTPTATTTALQCFENPVVLLCGGQDKRVPLDELCQAISRRARVVIIFGEVRARLATHLRRLESHPAIKSVHEFNGGVTLARRAARAGEVVLFSPGFPSFDAFDNYAARGDHFKALVNGWVGGP